MHTLELKMLQDKSWQANVNITICQNTFIRVSIKFSKVNKVLRLTPIANEYHIENESPASSNIFMMCKKLPWQLQLQVVNSVL